METISSILDYFFTSVPGKEFAYYNHFYIFIGILFIGSIVFGQIYKKKRKTDVAFKRLYKKVSSRLIIFAIIFGFLILARYEKIPYFSTRILLSLTSLIFIYWLYKNIKSYKTSYLKEKRTEEHKKIVFKEKKEEKIYSASKKRK